MIEMRQVYSSHVAEIGFEDGELVVEWANGKRSAYSGVPAELAEQVMTAPSIGSALRESIKGVYPHKYL